MLLCASLLLFVASPSCSRERSGPPSSGDYSTTFGQAICPLDDVDGDGLGEFLVADPGFAGGAWKYDQRGERGSVWILSGRDGSVLRRLDSPELDDGFGASLAAAGDVSGDGVPDVIVGTNELRERRPGKVYLFSGADGQLLRVLTGDEGARGFGKEVAGGADLDGDGVADLLVGQASGSGESAGQQLRVFSGADGERLCEVDREVAGESYRLGIGWWGDVDGDGTQDFYSCGYFMDEGCTTLTLYSGRTGSRLARRSAPEWNHVGRVSDRDGDGWAEFALVNYREVRILSGRSLRVLKVVTLEEHSPGETAEVGDLDGDGVADLAVGDDGWGISQGRVLILSGRSGELLEVFEAGISTWHFGMRVEAVGDHDGDGVGELLIANDTVVARAEGTVWLVSGRTGEALYSVRCRLAGQPVVSR